MRFLHTSDWQMGMRRHFLDQHNQSIFDQARVDAVRQLTHIAQETACAFIVVAGDIFESNFVNPRTVSRTMDALKGCNMPIFLLPANHDPLDAASVYHSTHFKACKPEHVTVLSPGETHRVGDHTEVVGATWTSKRMPRNPLAELLETLEPVPETHYRIIVAHGAAGSLSPTPDLTEVPMEASLRAMSEDKLHYLALGDRHSKTKLHERIWFSGSPEPTDYDEDDPGYVLVVDLSSRQCLVEPHRVATWQFVRETIDLPLERPADAVRHFLEGLSDKSRTIVRCTLRGTISLKDSIEIETLIEQERERFGAIERPKHRDQFSIMPNDTDFSELQVSGYAQSVLQQLTAEVQQHGDQAKVAEGALALFYRLAGGGRS